MFEHQYFDVYDYNNIPLNRDCYLIDQIYINDYEKSLLKVFNNQKYGNVGYIAYVAVRKIYSTSIELSWYPNIFDRFHEVTILLPKEDFIICVGSSQYDEKPHLFVKSEWFDSLHTKYFSVFGLIDAIDVKIALRMGTISKQKLISLRDKIDNLAKNNPDVSFVSFADSILLKSNWTAGHFQKGIKYTYRPELFIHLYKELKSIYKEILELDIYAIFAQGSNEYYDDPLLHISKSKNHISLNSMGISFAELLAIDEAIRSSINKVHPPSEIYMDEHFYHSLKLKYEFDKNTKPKNTYKTKMKSEYGFYYYTQCQTILDSLSIH